MLFYQMQDRLPLLLSVLYLAELPPQMLPVFHIADDVHYLVSFTYQWVPHPHASTDLFQVYSNILASRCHPNPGKRLELLLSLPYTEDIIHFAHSFLANGVQEFLHAFAADRVYKICCDLRQRNQNKRSLMQARMRYAQVSAFDLCIVVEENVDVNRAWRVPKRRLPPHT